MSGLEKTELVDRIKAMTPEEKLLAVRLFPSDILIGEVARRSLETERMVSTIRDLVKVKG